MKNICSDNFTLGGELSGHIFFKDKWPGFDDGIYAGLRLVEALSTIDEDLSTLVQAVPKYFSSPEIKIKSTEAIPVMTHESVRQEEIKYAGLDVLIYDIFLEKDPFDNMNTISLDLIIKNYSKTDFSSFDIALVSDLRHSYNPSIFTDYKNSLAMKNIKRGESVSGILSFSVDNPKREHWLVFYDKRTRKPLAKISINNAMKDLKITDLEKQKKKRRKKDKMVF